MPRDFNSLVGHTLPFFGADDSCIMLDGEIWRAVEDPDDGYRSMLREIEYVAKKGKLVFHKRAFANVKVMRLDEDHFEGYCLVDVDDQHRWLRMDTDGSDDYYPCFTFEYTPKPKIKYLKEFSKFHILGNESVN